LNFKLVHPDYGVCTAVVYPAFELTQRRGEIVPVGDLDVTHDPEKLGEFDDRFTYIAIAQKCVLEFCVIGMKEPLACLWHDRDSAEYTASGLDGVKLVAVPTKDEAKPAHNVAKRPRGGQRKSRT
jgi:hypothetical protein